MPIHSIEPQQRFREIARLGLYLEKLCFFQFGFVLGKFCDKFTQPSEAAGRYWRVSQPIRAELNLMFPTRK